MFRPCERVFFVPGLRAAHPGRTIDRTTPLPITPPPIIPPPIMLPPIMPPPPACAAQPVPTALRAKGREQYPPPCARKEAHAEAHSIRVLDSRRFARWFAVCARSLRRFAQRPHRSNDWLCCSLPSSSQIINIIFRVRGKVGLVWVLLLCVTVRIPQPHLSLLPGPGRSSVVSHSEPCVLA